METHKSQKICQLGVNPPSGSTPEPGGPFFPLVEGRSPWLAREEEVITAVGSMTALAVTSVLRKERKEDVKAAGCFVDADH